MNPTLATCITRWCIRSHRHIKRSCRSYRLVRVQSGVYSCDLSRLLSHRSQLSPELLSLLTGKALFQICWRLRSSFLGFNSWTSNWSRRFTSHLVSLLLPLKDCGLEQGVGRAHAWLAWVHSRDRRGSRRWKGPNDACLQSAARLMVPTHYRHLPLCESFELLRRLWIWTTSSLTDKAWLRGGKAWDLCRAIVSRHCLHRLLCILYRVPRLHSLGWVLDARNFRLR